MYVVDPFIYLLHSAIKPENLMWFTKEEREEKEKR